MNKVRIAIGLLILVISAITIGYIASSSPDGLEKVAERSGFADLEAKQRTKGIAPEYLVPGIHNKRVSGGLAAFAGIVLTFGLTWGVGAYAARKRRGSRG